MRRGIKLVMLVETWVGADQASHPGPNRTQLLFFAVLITVPLSPSNPHSMQILAVRYAPLRNRLNPA